MIFALPQERLWPATLVVRHIDYNLGTVTVTLPQWDPVAEIAIDASTIPDRALSMLKSGGMLQVQATLAERDPGQMQIVWPYSHRLWRRHGWAAHRQATAAAVAFVAGVLWMIGLQFSTAATKWAADADLLVVSAVEAARVVWVLAPIVAAWMLVRSGPPARRSNPPAVAAAGDAPDAADDEVVHADLLLPGLHGNSQQPSDAAAGAGSSNRG